MNNFVISSILFENIYSSGYKMTHFNSYLYHKFLQCFPQKVILNPESVNSELD